MTAQVFTAEFFNDAVSQHSTPPGWVGIMGRDGRFIARNYRADERVGQLAKADLTAAARANDVGLIRHQTLEGVDSVALAENEREALLQGEHRARVRAEAENIAKDHFLARLRHELRNPLAAINGAIALNERYGHDTAEAAEARGYSKAKLASDAPGRRPA